MHTRHSISLLTALCLLETLAGCAASPGTPAPSDSTKFTVENTDRFVVLDAATEAAVNCTGLQERTLGDGRLEVIANVKNRDSAPTQVQIQCLFLDDQGLPVVAAGSWKVLALGGGSTEAVRFTAPDAAAKRYAIRVRKVR
ncbi:MAG TPA: YcfL family protein [Opitutaceae bacterium]|nr:YcfL family protein [Opitutaceae bacterium]